MKKSLIAFGAALACLGAAQAQSNVQLTGLVDMYVGSMKTAGNERTSQVGSGGMTTSWWGMNGTEDLGNGLKAGFALGAFFRADTGTPGRFNGDTFFARDANVSLSGGFGTLKLGRSMAPNFLPTILFNPYGDSFTLSPLVLHSVGNNAADTGWSNQITYSTPTFAGLRANLQYQFGEQAGSTGTNNVGANLFYNQGPLALTAVYEQADIGNPGLANYNAAGFSKDKWMLGAAYDFSVVKLYATYGQATQDFTTGASDIKKKTYSLGLDVPVTKAGTVKVAMAQTKTENVSGKWTTATVGYDHFLSKRTDAYAAAMYDKNSALLDNKSGTSFAVGIRHRF